MPVKRPVCLICFVFLFVIYIVTAGKVPKPSWNVKAAEGKTLTAYGTVFDRQEKNGTFQVFLKDVTTDQTYFPKRMKGITVKLSLPETGRKYAKIGSRIGVKGVFAPFEAPRCEGMFDASAYYMIKGYEGELVRARITGVSKGYDVISESLRSLRESAFNVLKENMDEEDSGLVGAMTLGDKTGLDPQIKELYQNAGISHVLALSGLHIASVGLALLKVLKKTRLPAPAASAAAFAIIAAYAVMTGMSTSTVRAMIMFGLYVLSGIIGRTYDLLSAAAVSALCILAANPYSMYDTGFLLSFGAVLGITCIYPILVCIPPKISDNGIWQSVCISISVTLATLPAVADSFMQISLCSVIINLIVIPLMGLVLVTGFSGMILGLTGIKPTVILKITHYILRLYEVLGKISEKIDGNILLTGKPHRWQVITYAIIVISVVITHNSALVIKLINNAYEKFVDPTGRRTPSNNGRNFKKIPHKITYRIENALSIRKSRLLKATGNTITIVVFAIAIVIITTHTRSDLEIRTVDVGQGDCSLIWGEDVPVIMIDGGSSDIKQVAKYRIVPVLKANRVRKIDYCFLTHMDSDHVNGVIEMIEDETCPVSIKRLIVSAPAMSQMLAKEPSENAIRLYRAAIKRKIRLMVVGRGDRLSAGRLDIRCINPQNGGFSDENDNSLVLSVNYKDPKTDTDFTGMFTGDIGENVEKSIIQDLEDVSYLKVAHHGSRNSTSDDFLKRTSPEICVIFAGVDNSYGHPHKETIKRLEKVKPRILCTADSGEILLIMEEKKTLIRRMLHDP